MTQTQAGHPSHAEIWWDVRASGYQVVFETPTTHKRRYLLTVWCSYPGEIAESCHHVATNADLDLLLRLDYRLRPDHWHHGSGCVRCGIDITELAVVSALRRGQLSDRLEIRMPVLPVSADESRLVR